MWTVWKLKHWSWKQWDFTRRIKERTKITSFECQIEDNAVVRNILQSEKELLPPELSIVCHEQSLECKSSEELRIPKCLGAKGAETQLIDFW